jgi:hypothetical protein
MTTKRKTKSKHAEQWLDTPPALRPKREANKILRLLDQLAAKDGTLNREDIR